MISVPTASPRWGDLIRGIPDNPLIWYFDPRRRNLAGYLFRLFELLLLITVVLAVLDIILQLDAELLLGRRNEPIEIAFNILFFASFLLPIFFLIFAPPPWDADRIQEMRLSALSAHEATVGFLFWPMLTVIGAALMAGIWFLLLTGGMMAPTKSFGGIASELLLTLLGTATVGLLTLDFWITRKGQRWLALFLVPARLTYLFGPLFLLYIIVKTYWSQRWTTLGGSLANCGLGLFLILWFLSRIEITFSGLPARLYAAADAEALLRVHPPSRARAFWLEPSRARNAIWRSWKRWALGAWIDALGLMAAGALLTTALVVLYPDLSGKGVGGGVPNIDLTIFLIMMSLQSFGALIMLVVILRRLFVPGTVAPISGGTEWSLAPYYLPYGILGGCLFTGLGLLIAGRSISVYGFLSLALFFLITLATYRSLAVSALAARPPFVLPVLLVAVMCWSTYLLSGSAWPALSIVAVLALAVNLFSPHEDLRLFRRSLAHVPIGGLAGVDDQEEFLVDDQLLERFKSRVLKQ